MFLKSVLLSIVLASGAYAAPSSEGEDPIPKDPKKLGHIPAGLQYGPAFGVDYATIKTHPKNFNDDIYMGIDGDNVHYRVLSHIHCEAINKQVGGELASIRTTYAYRQDTYDSQLHGYTPVALGDKRDRDIPDDEFRANRFDFRVCRGIIEGFSMSVKGTDNILICGKWNAYRDNDGCTYPILVAPFGRKIVGIYGDAGGDVGTPRRGVRGFGLITLPL